SSRVHRDLPSFPTRRSSDLMPNAVVTVGGRFGYVDDGETPNTELSLFDYGDAQMVFEVRGLKTEKYKGADVGVIWLGTDGMVVRSEEHTSELQSRSDLVCRL